MDTFVAYEGSYLFLWAFLLFLRWCIHLWFPRDDTCHILWDNSVHFSVFHRTVYFSRAGDITCYLPFCFWSFNQCLTHGIIDNPETFIKEWKETEEWQFYPFCVAQVDNEQLDLGSKDIESMDATKLSRFIEINSLHLVTEYSPAVNNGSCIQPLTFLFQGVYLSSEQRPFPPGYLIPGSIITVTAINWTPRCSCCHPYHNLEDW